MDMDASMATFRPKSVFISCSFIAPGACSEMSAVRPLIPMVERCGMGGGGTWITG
jgi:hypothetical protein